MFERAREYWKTASSFPANKEAYYPEHTLAQEFDRWVPSVSTAPYEILEYGCGGGSDAESYLRRGNWVTAVDISPVNVATTRARLDALGPDVPHWQVELLERSAAIPVPANTFDVASAHGVLHHIPQPTVSKVVAEIHRVLKPGGFFYAMLYTQKYVTWKRADIDRLMADKGLCFEEAFGWCTDSEGCPWAEPYDAAKAEALFKPVGFQCGGDLAQPQWDFEYNDGFFTCYRMRKL